MTLDELRKLKKHIEELDKSWGLKDDTYNDVMNKINREIAIKTKSSQF